MLVPLNPDVHVLVPESDERKFENNMKKIGKNFGEELLKFNSEFGNFWRKFVVKVSIEEIQKKNLRILKKFLAHLT